MRKLTALLLGMLLLAPAFVHAAPRMMALEVVIPRASGTGTPAIGSMNRIFWAYPSIEYNIQCVAIGGVYPYSYAITSNKPAWLEIDASTGVISGTAPASGTFSNIQVTVTDAESSTATGTWTITVDSSKFKFIDASAGSNGTGTISSPYQTITYMLDHAASTDIIYFRSGTTHTLPIYHPNSTEWEITNYATHGCYLSYSEGRANQWVAYPGESPVVNMDGHFVECYGTSADNFLMDGLEFYGMVNGGFYSEGGADYFVVRRCDFHGLTRDHSENDNNSFLQWGDGDQGYYKIVYGNEFHDYTGCHAVGSIYYSTKTLVANNTFYDSVTGTLVASLAPKRGLQYTTIRGNTFRDLGAGTYPMGHSVNSMFRYSNYAEICFNLYNCPGSDAFPQLNSAEQAQNMYFYRNTIVGNANLEFLDSASYKPLGPYTFENCVIQNSAAGLTYLSECGSVRAVEIDNLKGTSGLVDASGNLVNEDYIGTYGYQVGDEEEAEDTTAPTVSITTSDPSSSTTSSISIAWTDSDDTGVTSRKWRIGSAPDATHGTEATSPATITGLQPGNNTVYIGAADLAGNWGSDSITVNYILTRKIGGNPPR